METNDRFSEVRDDKKTRWIDEIVKFAGMTWIRAARILVFFNFDDFLCIIFCDDFKPGSCLHVRWLLQLQSPVQETINASVTGMRHDKLKRSKSMATCEMRFLPTINSRDLY